jgi:predicted PurR-regulated permease PerM
MIPNIQIRQMLLLILIAAIFGLIFWNLLLFLPALLGAYTLYVLLHRPVIYLTDIRKWNSKLAAATLMLLSFAIILLPIYALIGSLYGKMSSGFRALNTF